MSSQVLEVELRSLRDCSLSLLSSRERGKGRVMFFDVLILSFFERGTEAWLCLETS